MSTELTADQIADQIAELRTLTEATIAHGKQEPLTTPQSYGVLALIAAAEENVKFRRLRYTELLSDNQRLRQECVQICAERDALFSEVKTRDAENAKLRADVDELDSTLAEQKRLLWNADMIAAAIRSRTTTTPTTEAE